MIRLNEKWMGEIGSMFQKEIQVQLDCELTCAAAVETGERLLTFSIHTDLPTRYESTDYTFAPLFLLHPLRTHLRCLSWAVKVFPYTDYPDLVASLSALLRAAAPERIQKIRSLQGVKFNNAKKEVASRLKQ